MFIWHFLNISNRFLIEYQLEKSGSQKYQASAEFKSLCHLLKWREHTSQEYVISQHLFFLLFGHSFIPGYGDNRGLCGHRGINNDSDKINYSCLVWVSLLTKISINMREFDKKYMKLFPFYKL